MRRLFVLLVLVLAAWPAAAFTLTDTQGRVHRLADYKGRWVLVNFWATWCPPCLEEMPDLQRLHEARKDLVVIGIAMQYRDPEYVKKFAEDMLVSYPIVLGDERIARQVGPVPGLPTSYLYDPSGKQVAYHVGALGRADVERFIEKKKSAR